MSVLPTRCSSPQGQAARRPRDNAFLPLGQCRCGPGMHRVCLHACFSWLGLPSLVHPAPRPLLVTHWLVPALPTCRYVPRQLHYPSATPSTPRQPGRCLVCPMNHCTVFRGHGATVLSPLKTSPARGRVSAAFPSRRPSKRLYSLPGCAGANRRRPRRFLRGRMCLRTACATVLPACRIVPADPQSATSMRSFGRTRGPRPEWGAAHPVHTRSARAGPAAVRTALPCPVASSCAPTTVTQRKQ